MDNNELLQELQQIRVELQSNNKALQSMVAGLMELLSKLQPGKAGSELVAQLAEDLGKAKEKARHYDLETLNKNYRINELEREAVIVRNFLSTIPVHIFINEAGEITSIVMKEEPK